MAIDEAILRSRNKGIILHNTLRLYSWSPSAVSIGRNQDLTAEVNVEESNNLGVDIIRRISGGGAVFHDEYGEITYSAVFDSRELDSTTLDESYYKVTGGISAFLSSLGLKSDGGRIHCPSIFVDRKKISGNARAQIGNIILQHGTILVRYRPEIMYSVLKATKGRSKSNMVESVRQNVTTLEHETGQDLTISNLVPRIIEGFESSLNVQFVEEELTVEETRISESLMELRYKNEEWLLKRKFDGF